MPGQLTYCSDDCVTHSDKTKVFCAVRRTDVVRRLVPSLLAERLRQGSKKPPRKFSGRLIRETLEAISHHFCQGLGNHLLLQTQHEAKKGAVIRYHLQFQGAAQFAMLRQANFRRTKRPIFVPHQTQNPQQLRLLKTLRPTPITIRRYNFSTYLHSDTGK